MIIVGFVLLLLQGISETVKAFYRWRGWEAADEAPKEVH
jgi:TRAP-type mannitol/chloroaromatic compound transport system permease small subunit